MKILVNTYPGKNGSHLEKLMKRIARGVLIQEKADGILSITLSDDKTIRRLNREYRHKDKPASILSFPMREDGLLGDIILSVGRVGKDLEKLVIHGTLHILGYKHGRKMEEKDLKYGSYMELEKMHGRDILLMDLGITKLYAQAINII